MTGRDNTTKARAAATAAVILLALIALLAALPAPSTATAVTPKPKPKPQHAAHKHKPKPRPKPKPKPKPVPGPCDIYDAGHTPCVAAFSSTRALFMNYYGPLYEVQRASDDRTMNVGLTSRGGYANAAQQNAFCAHTSCVVLKIYDQTADHNDLMPQGPTTAYYSNTKWPHDPVSANALPITAGGAHVYGLKFQDDLPNGLPCSTAAGCTINHGQAYNNGHLAAKGVAVNGQAEGAYAVFGGTFTGAQCCFDFGNSEVAGTDNGAGHMDAINFSRDCWDACGAGAGPWVEADLEDGMFMTGTPTPIPENSSLLGGTFKSGLGFCCDGTDTNLAMPYPFVTAMLTNPGALTFTIKGANANTGRLATYYSGPTPPGTGYNQYSPMRQEGAIILGSGGDQGTTDGEFFEGAMTIGVPSNATEAAVQANIVGVHYTMPTPPTATTNAKPKAKAKAKL